MVEGHTSDEIVYRKKLYGLLWLGGSAIPSLSTSVHTHAQILAPLPFKTVKALLWILPVRHAYSSWSCSGQCFFLHRLRCNFESLFSLSLDICDPTTSSNFSAFEGDLLQVPPAYTPGPRAIAEEPWSRKWGFCLDKKTHSHACWPRIRTFQVIALQKGFFKSHFCPDSGTIRGC